MKLFAIFILYKEDNTRVKILQNEFNLSNFSYFQRHYIIPQFLAFSARTLVQRIDVDKKQSLELEEQNINEMMHVYVRSDGLASVVISTKDYPMRVAHSLINRVMDDFTKIYSSTSWKQIAEESGKMTSLNETFAKYQKPEDADALLGLQKDLDETKEILVDTLEKLLERGEKLDDLVERSNQLSSQAKLFYKVARRNNRCCNLF